MQLRYHLFTRNNANKTRMCYIKLCVRDDCYGYGVSPVDASLRIIRGRTDGGVGFIWKKHLESNVSLIECEYDWLCCLKGMLH